MTDASADGERQAIDDLLAHIRQTELTEGHLSGIEQSVETLCSAYSTDDPRNLRARTEAVLEEIDELLSRRLTLNDHQRLLEQAGWLALLMAALSFDLGKTAEAEHARQVGIAVGLDLQSPSILGWAHETAVWMEISHGRWREAIHKADEALQIVGAGETTGVAVQITLQRAEAFARLDEAEELQDSLEDARSLLAAHQPPENPKNHFRFDHAKFDVREMRLLLVAGRDDAAEQIALRLQESLSDTEGSPDHPMRLSEVLAGLGLIEARRGNIEQAVDYANQAMNIGRKSRLSFRQITSAVAEALAPQSHLVAVRNFLDRRAELVGEPE